MLLGNARHLETACVCVISATPTKKILITQQLQQLSPVLPFTESMTSPSSKLSFADNVLPFISCDFCVYSNPDDNHQSRLFQAWSHFNSKHVSVFQLIINSYR